MKNNYKSFNLIVLSLVTGLFAAAQPGQIEIESAPGIGIKISSPANTGIFIDQPQGLGIGVANARFPAGSFNTSNTSVWPAIVANQSNPGGASIFDRYPDIQMQGSHIISSTGDFNIIYNASSFSGGYAFSVVSPTNDFGAFTVEESGDGSFGGKLSLFNEIEIAGSNTLIKVKDSWTDSDLALESNDNIDMRLDDDGNTSTAAFRIFDTWNNLIFSASESGAIHCGGTLLCSSDRNLKENIHSVETSQILQKVLSLPVYYWNYTDNPVRHLGPMAQDFYASFSLGDNDKTIATIDADGVALAAIKGLHELMVEELAKRDAIIEELQAELVKNITN